MAKPTTAQSINPLIKQQVIAPQPRMETRAPGTAMTRSPPALQAPQTSGFTPRPTNPTPPVPGPTSAPQQKSPERRLEDDAAAGYAHADKYGIGAEGSMGRLVDEYKGEIDELLAQQKAGLAGMTAEEMQAAREQGTAGINRQMATNLAMLGDVAAGQGVRGGSAAGLQMGALSDAQAASGQLSRQLILDNLAQKNIAMDRYGNTLTNQQGVGLGLQDSNNRSANAERLARELAAGNYTSLIDSYRSGDKADDFTQQSLDIAREQIDQLRATGKLSEKEAAQAKQTEIRDETKNKLDVMQDSQGTSPDIAVDDPIHVLARKYGVSTYAELPEKIKNSPEGRAALYESLQWNDYVRKHGGKPDDGAHKSTQASNPKIICTEAYRQGLISREKWEVTQRYRYLLSLSEMKGYLTWATPVAQAMRAKPTLARLLLPLITRMIEGERYALGEVPYASIGVRAVMGAVKAANTLGAVYRAVRLHPKPLY